jgi:hypothetical protein
MGKKGQRGTRGQADMYDEVKGRYNMTLTPTAVKGLDALAQSMNLSRSELVEQFGRGKIPILTPELATQLGKPWNTSSP